MATEEPDARQVIAFFDVDNTLLRGASLYYFGRGAFRRGYLGLRDITIFAWQQARFVSVGENKQHLESVRERALGLLSGHTVAELQDLAREIVEDDILPRLWPDTMELARNHQEQGHEVWLVTATPSVVADELARRLGFDGALGTELEEVDGIYTGDLKDHVLHGDRKVQAVKKLVQSRHVDLADCWAYSDSRNDVPLLNLVGNRIAINPDKALERYAKARHWKVLELKKSSIREARKAVKKAEAERLKQAKNA